MTPLWVILFSPLSASSLSTLLHLPKGHVDQTLDDLHAILDIPEDQTRPLRLHHPSFRDFLLNKSRCDDSKFWVNEKQAHRTMAVCASSHCERKHWRGWVAGSWRKRLPMITGYTEIDFLPVKEEVPFALLGFWLSEITSSMCPPGYGYMM